MMSSDNSQNLVNGHDELPFLLGAIEVLRRELSTTHQPVEVMERLTWVKSRVADICLIRQSK